MTERVFNFSAGPAAFPEKVLMQARDEMMSLPGLGMSVMEISHRSDEFKAIHSQAISNIRTLLSVPDDYEVLFLQGGSRLQFSMIPMNLASPGQTADYFVTGTWSKKSVGECEKIAGVTPNVVCDFSESGYDRIPAAGEVKLNPDAAYAYYCSNETVQGVQFLDEPDVGDVPLICDSSSDIFCRPLPVQKYGMIYACAQKNAGPAGVTIVIMRKDLVERSSDDLPGYLSFKTHADAGSMFNTPPTFAIYMVNLVAKWLLNDVGGLDKMFARNQEKASMLYEVIDNSDGFYVPHAQPDSRSIMNVTFKLAKEDLLGEFVQQAAERRLCNLKGHRSVGGIRASIYNAVPVEGVTELRDFMTEFRSSH